MKKKTFNQITSFIIVKPQAFFMHDTIVYGHKNDNFASVHSLFMSGISFFFDDDDKKREFKYLSNIICNIYSQ